MAPSEAAHEAPLEMLSMRRDIAADEVSLEISETSTSSVAALLLAVMHPSWITLNAQQMLLPTELCVTFATHALFFLPPLPTVEAPRECNMLFVTVRPSLAETLRCSRHDLVILVPPQNLAIVERIKALADKKGCLPGQLALAWVHAQGKDVFPIPGAVLP